MKNCEIKKMIQGYRAVDGAGVSMVRVLGNTTMQDFDPFLMLDTFDSDNPDDYTAGFPTHPHRGMETVTYLIHGEIEHQDSLGNQGVIRSGESQWMTAGSGIMHQEMPQPAEKMLGFQLWLNLPKEEKMTEPAYLEITQSMMPTIEKEKAIVRVVSGEFEGVKGVTPRHIPATIYDIQISDGGKIELLTRENETTFIFLIEGDGIIQNKDVPVKTAILFGKGESVSMAAKKGENLRVIYFSAKPLHEPVAWGGPIVMNTNEELRTAFSELNEGTFIKHRPIS